MKFIILLNKNNCLNGSWIENSNVLVYELNLNDPHKNAKTFLLLELMSSSILKYSIHCDVKILDIDKNKYILCINSCLCKIRQYQVCKQKMYICLGVWSPSQTPEAQRKEFDFTSVSKSDRENENKRPETEREPPPVVWTPRSAGASPTAERKTFKPVNFESPKLARKTYASQKSEVW